MSREPERAYEAYVGKIAWPTLLLVVVLSLVTFGVQSAALVGVLPLWAATVVLVPVIYLWFTPLHEATHGNIGGRRSLAWLDTVVGWVAGFAFMAPYPAFKAVHLRHHGATNREGRDPDLWVCGDGVVSTTMRCLTILPHYYWMFAVHMRGESSVMRRAANRAALGFVFIGLLAGTATWMGYGLEVLALWFLPSWVASGVLAFAFDWLPHHDHTETGRFSNTRVIEAGPVLAALLAGQDAHLIHHLWPRVPFYRYHSVLRAVRPKLESEGVRFVSLRRSTRPRAQRRAHTPGGLESVR